MGIFDFLKLEVQLKAKLGWKLFHHTRYIKSFRGFLGGFQIASWALFG